MSKFLVIWLFGYQLVLKAEDQGCFRVTASKKKNASGQVYESSAAHLILSWFMKVSLTSETLQLRDDQYVKLIC